MVAIYKDPIVIMAKTVYGEMRDKDFNQMVRFARKLISLVVSEHKTIEDICTEPGQFVDSPHRYSCWDYHTELRDEIDQVTLETDAKFRDSLAATIMAAFHIPDQDKE